jgi:hypothetical protein
MDRRTYKSKPQHILLDTRTGEIKKIIHSANTEIGNESNPSDLRVYGDLYDSQGYSFLDHGAFGFRLTLSSSCPLHNADITSGSTLYLTPYNSGYTSLYDGSKWKAVHSDQISMTLSGLTSGKNYDVFLRYNINDEPTLSLVVWTNDLTRSTALARQDGILVSSTDSKMRYVGTVRAVSSTQLADSKTQRFVWNYYNRCEKSLVKIETADSWLYTTPSYRAANNSNGNAVEIVVGLDDMLQININTHAHVSSSVAGLMYAVGVGIDTTTVNSANTYGTFTNGHATAIANYIDYVSPGYHKVYWLETSTSDGTQIQFFGDAGNSTYANFGLFGKLKV